MDRDGGGAANRDGGRMARTSTSTTRDLAASSELRTRVGLAGREIARGHSWDVYGGLVEQELAAIAAARSAV